MENSDDSESSTTNSWVFVEPNSSINSANRNYFIDCLQETVQELNESDLQPPKTELDSESDGISVISEYEEFNNEPSQSVEDVRDETVTTTDLANQISEIETKIINSKKDYINCTIIYNWLIAISFLLLAIILAQTFNKNPPSDTQSKSNIEETLNNNVIFETDDYVSTIIDEEDFEQKPTIYFKQTDTEIVSGRLNEIKKEKAKYDKQSKIKKHHTLDEALYTNEIIKEKPKNFEKPWKNKKKHDKDGTIINKEKRLEMQEEYLRRKEKFLLNKEYKLLQKEIELNKRMTDKDKPMKQSENYNTFSQMENVDKTKYKKKHKNKDSEYKKDKSEKKSYKEIKKPKYNKTVPGDWYDKLHSNRQNLRKTIVDSNWLLNQKNKFKNKARWYFQWMEDRENLRYKRGYKYNMY